MIEYRLSDGEMDDFDDEDSLDVGEDIGDYGDDDDEEEIITVTETVITPVVVHE